MSKKKLTNPKKIRNKIKDVWKHVFMETSYLPQVELFKALTCHINDNIDKSIPSLAKDIIKRLSCVKIAEKKA